MIVISTKRIRPYYLIAMEKGTNSLNLLLRFLLELVALFAIGRWGWQTGNDWTRYLFVILFPLSGALVWGIFAVPNDPSRSGRAPVPVPGWMRLILELGIFGLACWGLFVTGAEISSLVLLLLVVIHYSFSLDRIKWLFRSGEK